jgi:uncharacterized membrane protein
VSDPLQATCASATNAASDGDLGQMWEMLDPSVRWFDGAGELRAQGRPEVIDIAQGRADSGALSGARLERWSRVGEQVEVVVRLPDTTAGSSRLLAFLLTLDDDRIVEVRDHAPPR